ncbi:MAG: Rieske 2Fe-2S domain-containing protein [Deltaproteobacteria bacterium]|nr:Rieske 2Fe-2S domain-containing protein [Deltaproteobacteria bacterium]
MAYKRVANLAEIPNGRGLCVRVGSLDIGLFRVDDEIYAMENRCPHRDSPLSEGQLTGNVIVCREHGWDFDVRTGFKPGDPDGWPIPCFAVRVEDDQVWIDPDEVINLEPRRSRN